MTILLRLLIFVFIPTILLFTGKNEAIIKILIDCGLLSENLDIATTQLYCYIVGCFTASVLYPIQLERLKLQKEKHHKLFTTLLNHNKERFFDLIEYKLKEHNENLNECNFEWKTRLFKPKKGAISWFKDFFLKQTTLELVFVDGITDHFPHKSLHFEIKANEYQGLVGKSYKLKQLCIDLDLSDNTYSLTKAQITKIPNIEFCSTIPIFNKNQTRINAILSVDSETKFAFNKVQKESWEEHMKRYGAFIDKHLNL